MSAAQDVVQQLILRLIHFLLNCLQTPAVIQPVSANPRRCLARTVWKSRGTWRLFIHQLQRRLIVSVLQLKGMVERLLSEKRGLNHRDWNR